MSWTLGDYPPPDPAKPPVEAPVLQTIRVRALSTWNALLLGIVTGFAVSLGSLLFQKAADRIGVKERSR